MKCRYYFLFLLLGSAISADATTTRGVVVRRISGCDYFIVQTRTDYSVLEWFGGHDPDKDDVLIGNFNSSGFHTFLYANDDDKTSRLYVEDYGLTKSDAMEKLLDECE